MDIEPAPTDDEAAAIVAACEVLWPTPAMPSGPPRLASAAWRFSGRWWTGTAIARRSRP